MATIGERTKGYCIALYDEFFDEFGNDPFPAGRLKKKISHQLVRGVYDVGLEPRNRNLSDREVVGSRLRSLGFIELLPMTYEVRITESCSSYARELIASLEAK